MFATESTLFSEIRCWCSVFMKIWHPYHTEKKHPKKSHKSPIKRQVPFGVTVGVYGRFWALWPCALVFEKKASPWWLNAMLYAPISFHTSLMRLLSYCDLFYASRAFWDSQGILFESACIKCYRHRQATVWPFHGSCRDFLCPVRCGYLNPWATGELDSGKDAPWTIFESYWAHVLTHRQKKITISTRPTLLDYQT